MIKRIFWLGSTIIVGAIGLIFLLNSVAEAAGTYKLDYPANYGCKCTPNYSSYGHFKTQWRTWPGEQRLDKTYPGVINREALPPTKGIEQLPLPREKLQELAPPSGPQPGDGGMPNGLEQPRGPMVPGPGGEGPVPDMQNPPPSIPNMPNLPSTLPEPGSFNPTPGLPPDLSLPGPLENSEKQPSETPKETPSDKKEKSSSNLLKDIKISSKPAVNELGAKPDLRKKGVSTQPSLKRNAETNSLNSSAPIRLPEITPHDPARENPQAMNQAHPQANWDSALQPGVYDETSRSGAIYPATDIARQIDYQAPLEPEESVRSWSDVVQQSYQQSQNSGRKSTLETPIDSKKMAVPPVALQGYCPVELCQSGRWVQGDPQWTVIHQGTAYRLSGNEQRQQFLAHPEQFVPAGGGNDPVIAAREQRNVPGTLTYCAAFKGRIYMFSSSVTQTEFQKNPERFLMEK